ncbi:hypothetical protein EGW08_015990 [Elysia chlorotica]|uniref:Uncharacterized protein n=1 Tax=Elysia chlorotica TaxID=188477 RepID=A0A3S1AZN7_ELYCH|nr:hypothetical protein EGW08_015990 [Elysia chlorotica]
MVKDDFVLALLASCLLIHIKSTSQGPTDTRGKYTSRQTMPPQLPGAGRHGLALANIHENHLTRKGGAKSNTIDMPSRSEESASVRVFSGADRPSDPTLQTLEDISAGAILPALLKTRTLRKQSASDLIVKRKSARGHRSNKMYFYIEHFLRKLHISFQKNRPLIRFLSVYTITTDRGDNQGLLYFESPSKTRSHSQRNRALSRPHKNITQTTLEKVPQQDLNWLHHAHASVATSHKPWGQRTAGVPQPHARSVVSRTKVKAKSRVARDTALITVSVQSIVPILQHSKCTEYRPNLTAL